jgi:hypothetical protein
MKKLFAAILICLPIYLWAATTQIEATVLYMDLDTYDMLVENNETHESVVYNVGEEGITLYEVGYILDITDTDGVIKIHESWKNKFR